MNTARLRERAARAAWGISTLSGYTVFGKVVSGMDVVDKIKAMPTGPGGPFATDAPRTQVVIDSATMVN